MEIESIGKQMSVWAALNLSAYNSKNNKLRTCIRIENESLLIPATLRDWLRLGVTNIGVVSIEQWRQKQFFSSSCCWWSRKFTYGINGWISYMRSEIDKFIGNDFRQFLIFFFYLLFSSYNHTVTLVDQWVILKWAIITQQHALNT